MKHLLAVAFLAAVAGTAHAGGQANSIGVGVESEINQEAGGLSVNYDAGKFHVGGFLGFHDHADNDPNTRSDFEIGARFFFHVHSTAMADFSLGGGVGIASIPVGGPAPAPESRDTHLYLEPSFQIRVFIASNVALSFTGGIVIGTLDADRVDIGGQVDGLAGIHYYFF
jgi:hypothetical protein